MKKILTLLLASLLLMTGIEARAQRVENGSHSTIGYVSNGRVENGSHSTIGYYDTSIKPEWVAFFFFFMKR